MILLYALRSYSNKRGEKYIQNKLYLLASRQFALLAFKQADSIDVFAFGMKAMPRKRIKKDLRCILSENEIFYEIHEIIANMIVF